MIQTWLPLPDFAESARTLTDGHLQDQRLHVLELLEFYHSVEESQLPEEYEPHRLLTNEAPIIRMWKGYVPQLAEYGLECCEEWGVRKAMLDPLYEHISFHLECAIGEEVDLTKPNWFGDVDFHLSHQAALLKKNRQHYQRYFMADGDRAVVWPVSKYAAKA